MMKVIRKNDKTLIEMGSITLKFKDQNRHGYNDLRKAVETFEGALIESLKKKKLLNK